MARSIEEVIRDTVGNQAVQIMHLIAEVERLQEALKEAQKQEAE